MYTSSTLALAALEVLAQVNRVLNAPSHFVAVPADLPASVAIERVKPSDLPSDWRRHPAPDALADIGEQWIRRARAPVLAVPSALIPQELNYLLNPRHSDFGRIRLGDPSPFEFDQRLKPSR